MHEITETAHTSDSQALFARRALALALSAMLAASAFPAVAFADDASGEQAPAQAGAKAETEAGSEAKASASAAPAAASYTVTYNANGGSVSKASDTVDEGGSVTLPAATRAGYVFAGWSDGTATYRAGASYTPAANVTLTAQWSANKANLTTRGLYQKSGSYTSTTAGNVVGKTSSKKYLTGISIAVAGGTNVSGNVAFRVWRNGKGWTDWATGGSFAGTWKSSRAASAIAIRLSGNLASAYDVYYRAYVKNYGWMAWAANGASAGAVNLRRHIRAYQVKLVAKTDKRTPAALSSQSSGKVAFANKSTNVEKFMGVVMAKKAYNRRSATKWLVVVDRNVNHFCVFKGRRHHWKLVRSWKCSTGKLTTRTPKGQFTLGSKGHSFGHGYTVYYFTQFTGPYFIHSIKYHEGTWKLKDPRLGKNVSMGCVRLATKNARWVQTHIPSGSRMYVY